MSKCEYDYFDAVEKSLESLDQFNILLKKRRQAFTQRYENLYGWIILGRFFLDPEGQIFRILKPSIPAEIFPHFPKVMILNDYTRHLERYGYNCKLPSSKPIPKVLTSNDVCPGCGLGWTIENCHEAVPSGSDFYHFECYRDFQADAELAYFRDLFLEADFLLTELSTTPNPYCQKELCPPWVKVSSGKLKLTVGNWRKTLIIIICEDPRVNLENLCPNCDVTKGKDYIHCWSREDALQILKKIWGITFHQ